MTTLLDGNVTIFDWRNLSEGYFSDRKTGQIHIIRLHRSVASTAIDALHLHNKQETSTHYIVENNGKIYQLVSFHQLEDLQI